MDKKKIRGYFFWVQEPKSGVEIQLSIQKMPSGKWGEKKW